MHVAGLDAEVLRVCACAWGIPIRYVPSYTRSYCHLGNSVSTVWHPNCRSITRPRDFPGGTVVSVHPRVEWSLNTNPHGRRAA